MHILPLLLICKETDTKSHWQQIQQPEARLITWLRSPRSTVARSLEGRPAPRSMPLFSRPACTVTPPRRPAKATAQHGLSVVGEQACNYDAVPDICIACCRAQGAVRHLHLHKQYID